MLGWKAFWLLGFHFWKHVFLKLTFRYRAGGAARFVDNYEPDRLLPVPPDARDALPEWQACIACGICDAVYPKPGLSLMGLVSGGLRDFSMMPDLAADAATFSDEGLLRAAAAACPTQVPIPAVVAHIAGSAARLDEALARTGA